MWSAGIGGAAVASRFRIWVRFRFFGDWRFFGNSIFDQIGGESSKRRLPQSENRFLRVRKSDKRRSRRRGTPFRHRHCRFTFEVRTAGSRHRRARAGRKRRLPSPRGPYRCRSPDQRSSPCWGGRVSGRRRARTTQATPRHKLLRHAAVFLRLWLARFCACTSTPSQIRPSVASHHFRSWLESGVFQDRLHAEI